MNNFSKIVICILIVMSFFFIKEKCNIDINIKNILPSFSSIKNINFNKPNEKTEVVKKPVEVPSDKKPQQDKKQKEIASIYFLALDSDGNGIYKKVQREVPEGENKLEYAIKELIKGPNIIEKSTGAYSEIPTGTKLLSIKTKGNTVIIDFSSDFENGGGTDSIYSRMMQLIKTALINTKNKKIYLYLDGKQVNFIGGEGIMITQPLNEKSLEV